jgi:bacterioferritin (cytochrome b1)
MYLVSAPPHRQFGEDGAWSQIQQIIEDQQTMIDKIADHVESLDGTPNMGEFPMEFTGMHDLSMEFILQKALSRQKNEAALIEQISADLEAGSQARALAQESLGAAKAHIESLEECLSTVSS